MAVDQRSKNWNWNTIDSQNYYKDPIHYSRASLAVLMDIRDELQKLNRVFECGNFLAIPYKLDRIMLNTKKTKKRRKSRNVKA